MGIVYVDNRIKTWITNHRISWCFILFGLGLGIGLFGNLMLGGDSKQMMVMGIIYAFLLPIIELTSGGSGTD